MKEENLIINLLGIAVDYTRPVKSRVQQVIAERVGMDVAIIRAQNKMVWGSIGLLILDCLLYNFEIISGLAFWYNLAILALIYSSWVILRSYTLGTTILKSHYQIEVLKRDWAIDHLIDNQADLPEQPAMKNQYFADGDKAIAEYIRQLGEKS